MSIKLPGKGSDGPQGAQTFQGARAPTFRAYVENSCQYKTLN